jgi:hypothetical protein
MLSTFFASVVAANGHDISDASKFAKDTGTGAVGFGGVLIILGVIFAAIAGNDEREVNVGWWIAAGGAVFLFVGLILRA